MRPLYRYLKWKTRRQFEKQVGGYLAEGLVRITYPFKPHTEPLNKFVIFTFQRTGSTFLADLLNSHPKILCEGEILLNRVFSPYQYLRYRTLLSGAEVYGFKLQTHHFTYQKMKDPDRFLELLNQTGYKIIKLKRRNVFQAALSLHFAVTSGRFHHSKLAGEVIQVGKTVDPQELMGKIKWIEQNSQQLDRYCSQFPHLEIIYEDHLQDSDHHQATADRIADFLDLPHARVASNLVKTMPEDYTAVIRNYAEIRRYLAGTKYEGFLD